MIKLKNIISKSIIGIVDTIHDTKSHQRGLEFAKYNSAWWEEFDTVVYSINGDKDYIENFKFEINNILRKPKVEILYSENLGHTFGTFDNDRKIFDYSKDKDYEYIWKFSNDIIAKSSIFDIEIDESKDFFYINNIGYAAFAKRTKEKLLSEIKDGSYFYPQTNYYIVKNKIHKWFPSYEEMTDLKKQFDEKTEQKKTDIKPWKIIPDCDCEYMLKKTIKENNLQPYHLLPDNQVENIINFIYTYKVGDGSHKNIMYQNLGDLCHYHVLNHPVATITNEPKQHFETETEYNERRKKIEKA